jgi:geranylgeranyl diphosphate synthase, type I
MTARSLDATTTTVAQGTIRAGVEAALADFLASRRGPGELAEVPEWLAAIREAAGSPGKRLRGMLCYWGWRGAGGTDASAAFRAAAGLELFHAAAIFHDDVIDGSDTRRGAPSLHRVLAGLVPDRAAGRVAAGQPFGTSAAVLAGDLCLIWAAELIHSACDDPVLRSTATRIFHEMAAEVMFGQYQDVVEEVRGPSDLRRALAVVTYKSARYTFERPLQLGGALAGAPRRVLADYGRFAGPAGIAFQLRDDMLGVFGDPAETGKSNLDDLRDGKATALMALALDAGTDAQRARITALHGRPDLDAAGAAELRELLVVTGAAERVEHLIQEHRTAARTALDRADLQPDVAAALSRLLSAAVDRSR